MEFASSSSPENPPDSIDTSSSIYVVDRTNREIKIFSKQSKVLLKTINFASYRQGEEAIDVVAHGNFLYVLLKQILVIDVTTGSLVMSMGKERFAIPMFLKLYRPADSTSDDDIELHVSDWGHHEIFVLHLVTGEKKRSIGRGSLKSPCGCVVWMPPGSGSGGSSGPLLMVSDCDHHRIAVFEYMSGEFLRSIGGDSGSQPGSFYFPKDIAIHRPVSGDGDDLESILIVLESGSCRVQVLNLLTYEFIRFISSQGESEEQLKSVYSMALNTWFDDDALCYRTDIVVSDMGSHRLQVFDLLSGDFVRSVGGRGDTSVQFKGPAGIYIQEEGVETESYILK